MRCLVYDRMRRPGGRATECRKGSHESVAPLEPTPRSKLRKNDRFDIALVDLSLPGRRVATCAPAQASPDLRLLVV